MEGRKMLSDFSVPHFSVRRPSVALLAVVALAAMVRWQHLGELSFEFDEAFCWKMIQFPVCEIWERSAMDNHPPGYFYLLWAWSRVFGDSPAALRSLSVVFGLVTVVGAYLLVRQIGRSSQFNLQFEICNSQFAIPRRQSHTEPGPLPTRDGEPELSRVRLPSELPALAAAGLVALSPMQVDFSQEARLGYAMGAALSVVSCWLLLRALHAREPRWRHYFYYALAATALAYTHNFGLFVVAGQALYAAAWLVLATERRRESETGRQGEGESVRASPPSVLSVSHSLPPSVSHPIPHPSSLISHRAALIIAFALIAALYSPWLPNFLRQRDQVSRLFHTRPFGWNEVAKACYQTLAVRWEDEPPSESVAWAAMAACLVPPLAMLIWGRGGLRLIGLCVLVTFDGAICASIADRNIIGSRYFLFANALLLCGLPPLLAGHTNPKRERGETSESPRSRFGLVLRRDPPRLRFGFALGATTLAGIVIGMAWLCLEHGARREGFARRPGMMAAMEYRAEVRQPDEPVLVCNPMLQIMAAAHWVGAGVEGGEGYRSGHLPHPSPGLLNNVNRLQVKLLRV
jgi:mannosyltransferase